jgi:hypothetical protein
MKKNLINEDLREEIILQANKALNKFDGKFTVDELEATIKDAMEHLMRTCSDVSIENT